eukprot:1039170-Rhodomonas_salina.3
MGGRRGACAELTRILPTLRWSLSKAFPWSETSMSSASRDPLQPPRGLLPPSAALSTDAAGRNPPSDAPPAVSAGHGEARSVF